MSIFRKNSTGWVEILSVFRKTATGWVEILNAYRKTATGWINVFQRNQIPGIVVTPKVRDSVGNNIDNSTYISRVGDTLYGYRGTWSNTPTSYEDRWAYSTASGGPYILFSPSQTNTTLATLLSYDEYYIVYQVRATNAAGTSDWVTSSNQAKVIRYQPVSIAKPTFSTTAAQVNIPITAVGTGSSYWQSTTNITNDTAPDPTDYPYQYSWRYYPTNTTPANTSNGSSYTPLAADVGKQLTVTVTATNSGGSTSRTSEPTLTVSEKPQADVNPTLTKPGYTGTSGITVGYTLRGNTGQWTPNPTTVYWGFQYASTNTATTGTTFSNGTNTSENQNNDLTVPSSYNSVSLIGKYIRFYTIADSGGGQSDVFYTDWVGPVYAAPTSPGAPNITYYGPYSSSQVYVKATWSDASSYSTYTVQYYNGSSYVDLAGSSRTTTGAVAGAGSEFLVPVGSYQYRVKNDNGDGIFAFSTANTFNFSSDYVFSFGNTLYPSTNGFIGLDSGFSGIGVPPTGRHFAVFPMDSVVSSLQYWSGGSGTVGQDSNKYVLRFDGYQFGQVNVASYRITWMATFYTDQSYADFKIITKGSNISGAITVGMYQDGTLVRNLPGPYTISQGSTFRIHYGNTTNSFGITYDEIKTVAPDDVMLTFGNPTTGNTDDGFWNITTAASQYKIPSITSTAATSNGSSYISVPFVEANSCDSVAYEIRETSYSGNLLESSAVTSSPIYKGGLTPITNYYLNMTPRNYKLQTGNLVQRSTITAPAAPTVSISNVTTSAFDVSWSSTGASSYYVDIYRSTTAISLSGYPTTTTNTSAGPFGLLSGTLYTIIVAAINSGGQSNPTTVSQRTLYDPLNPTFGANSRGTNQFTGSVTNYDANFTWSPTVTNGTFAWGIASGLTRPFTVTGLTDGQSSTVTITTTRAEYAQGSGNTTGAALIAPLNTTFGSNTRASGGFTGSVTNYDGNFTYAATLSPSTATFTWGTASGATRPFTISGLSDDTQCVVTLATTRTDYRPGTGNTTGVSLKSALTPTFGTNTRTSDGFTSSVNNYDSTFTFNLTTNAGSVSTGTASGSTLPFTVTGVSAGGSATVTVTTSKTDHRGGSATRTENALNSARTPTFGTNTSVPGGFNGSVSNYDSNWTWAITTNSGSVSFGTASGTTYPFSVTGLSGTNSATVTVTATRTGYVTGSAQSTGSANPNVAPNNGSATVSKTSGDGSITSARVGDVYTCATSVSGTPTPTAAFQWERLNLATSAWGSVSGQTSSTFSPDYTHVGGRFRCSVTFSNGVTPNLTVTSNEVKVEIPTITSITSSYSTVSPFCIWTVKGYNFQAISSRTIVNGVTQASPGTTSGATNNNPISGITRQTGTGSSSATYALIVRGESTAGGGGAFGIVVTTNTITNNATNRTNSPITNTFSQGGSI